jgi:hypothetical protein
LRMRKKKSAHQQRTVRGLALPGIPKPPRSVILEVAIRDMPLKRL